MNIFLVFCCFSVLILVEINELQVKVSLGHSAQNSSYRSVKVFFFFRTSKQFHDQENLENFLSLRSTMPKQAAEKLCQVLICI